MGYQIFLHIFIMIFLEPHLTYAHRYKSSTQKAASPFEFLDHLSVILQKGDNVEWLHRLKKHLMYLGYLNHDSYRDNNIFNDPLESAIKKYQEFFRLNVTGVLDASTISSLRRPRCGVPDFFTPQTNPMPVSSLYSFQEGQPKWNKTNLKYHMSKKITKSYRGPIELALLQWESVTKFKFTHVNNYFYNRADIIISFERGNHNCPDPFTTDNPSMAHTFPPPNGTVHFNADTKWASNGDRRAYDIQTVALHEFGHVLGLDHSNIPSAIMFPELALGQRKGLYQDDIKGIKGFIQLLIKRDKE